MSDYEVGEGKGHHIFLAAESYEQLLDDIRAWWLTVKEECKTIASIVFSMDTNDSTYGAEVVWSWLTPETKEKLTDLVQTLRDVPPVEGIWTN
jgi:hypothetical protein